MKAYLKFLSKRLSSLIVMICLLLLLNIIVYIFTFYGVISKDYGDNSPRNTLDFILENSTISGISDSAKNRLDSMNVWAAFLDKDGKVVWRYSAPTEFPDNFSVNEVAVFSKGYLLDYPVFIDASDAGLLILGYPKDSYFKLSNNAFSLTALRKLPLFFLLVIFLDILIVLFLYCRSKKRMVSNIEPILTGIESLSKGLPTDVNVDGDLKEISDGINRASQILSRQNIARANWIAGVSHDIRTPLSIILGYSDKIKSRIDADSDIHNYSKIIGHNSLKIKNLVSDLNVVSKLQYDMQPLNMENTRLSKLLRSFVADVLNGGLDDKYTLSLNIAVDAESLSVDCDNRLINRALSNLINNSINHNPDGCNINVDLLSYENGVKLIVSDDGVGVSEEQQKILEKPHYLDSLDDKLDLRHGLGTIIVREIVKAHGGKVETPFVAVGYRTELYFL